MTLCRDLTLGDVVSRDDLLHLAYLLACVAAGLVAARYHVQAEAHRLMTELVARARLTAPARPAIGGLLIIERNVMVYRRTWMILFSGFFEPLFYLFFFVYPLQEFIGDVTFEGETIEYAAFVAPALLASSAMNGAFYDATNVFWKLRESKVYESILATPVEPERRRGGGDDLGGCARDAVLGRFLFVIVVARARRFPVGDPRAACLLRHRLRLRGGRDRRRHVDADVEGLRPDPAGHAADVHVLGDLLSRSPCTRRCSSGSSAASRCTRGSS